MKEIIVYEMQYTENGILSTDVKLIPLLNTKQLEGKLCATCEGMYFVA